MKTNFNYSSIIVNSNLSMSKWNISLSTFKYYLLTLLVFTMISVVVGIRDLDVGTDTRTYVQIYESILNSVKTIEFEPGFHALSLISASMKLSGSSYLVLLSFLQFLLIIFAVKKMATFLDYGRNSAKFSLILISFFIISPFFLSAQINAIRQGIGAILLIYAAVTYLQKEYFSFIVWVLLALSFHFSSAIYALLIPLLSLGKKNILLITLLFFVLYVTGLSELIVKAFSNVTGLPVHAYIVEYKALHGYRSGVRLDFALFSIILPISAYAFVNLFLRRELKKITSAISIYLIFLIPFWIFGWGDYSNRYAFNAWLFIPFFISIAIYPYLRRFSFGPIGVIYLFAVTIFMLNLYLAIPR